MSRRFASMLRTERIDQAERVHYLPTYPGLSTRHPMAYYHVGCILCRCNAALATRLAGPPALSCIMPFLGRSRCTASFVLGSKSLQEASSNDSYRIFAFLWDVGYQDAMIIIVIDVSAKRRERWSRAVYLCTALMDFQSVSGLMERDSPISEDGPCLRQSEGSFRQSFVIL